MNLTPVDFKAVAAKGCYVYCYLREDGTPYYVGVGTTPYRPFQEHSCPNPRYDALIRVMRSGCADWAEAAKWEQFYIARYGRKNNGTGILRNLTDGGEGVKGLVFTEEHRANLSRGISGYWQSHPEQLEQRGQAISQGKLGGVVDAKTKSKIAATLVSNETLQATGLTAEAYAALPMERRVWIRNQLGAHGTVDMRGYTQRELNSAKRLGITIEVWKQLYAILGKTKHMKRTIERAAEYGYDVLVWAQMSREEKISIGKLA